MRNAEPIGAKNGVRCFKCEHGVNNAVTKTVLVTGGASYIGSHTCASAYGLSLA